MKNIFAWSHKKSPAAEAEPSNRLLSKAIGKLLLDLFRDKNGNLRAEDLISAAATIVGERCIDVAGEFSLREHGYIPGTRIFSEKINELICGNVATHNISDVPENSVVGQLRGRLVAQMFTEEEFPVLNDVFEYFSGHTGNPDDWGRTPLTVGREHWPSIHPLRVGYETRPVIDKIFDPIQEDKTRCLRVTAESLAVILMIVESVIDHRVALTLAIEAINGMAKTAPMTGRMMRNVARIH